MQPGRQNCQDCQTGRGCPTALGDWAVPASPFALCGSSGKARRLAASLIESADPHFTAQTHSTRSRRGLLNPNFQRDACSPAHLLACPPPPARACLFGRPPPCSSCELRSSEGASLGKCEKPPLNCNSDLWINPSKHNSQSCLSQNQRRVHLPPPSNVLSACRPNR
jgi:hypothetical protein